MIEKEDCKTLEEYCEKATQYYKDKGYHHTPLHAQLSFYQESNVNTCLLYTSDAADASPV